MLCCDKPVDIIRQPSLPGLLGSFGFLGNTSPVRNAFLLKLIVPIGLSDRFFPGGVQSIAKGFVSADVLASLGSPAVPRLPVAKTGEGVYMDALMDEGLSLCYRFLGSRPVLRRLAGG